MFIASKSLKAFIASQKSKTKLAKTIGISRQTLYLIIDGATVTAKMRGKILKVTGFGFEEAFEIK